MRFGWLVCWWTRGRIFMGVLSLEILVCCQSQEAAVFRVIAELPVVALSVLNRWVGWVCFCCLFWHSFSRQNNEPTNQPRWSVLASLLLAAVGGNYYRFYACVLFFPGGGWGGKVKRGAAKKRTTRQLRAVDQLDSKRKRRRRVTNLIVENIYCFFSPLLFPFVLLNVSKKNRNFFFCNGQS